MLIEFSVANYRSFKDRATFSMVAAPIKSKDKWLDAKNVFEARPGLSLLTSAAVYGANASGKSNFILAMQFMRQFLLTSLRDTSDVGGINLEPFRLSTETIHAPSLFEMVFMAEGTQYRYGFEADQERVHAEWLYHVPSERERALFVREKGGFELSDNFREGEGLEERTRPNALLLSVAAQFNGRLSQRVTRWFRETLQVVSGLNDLGLALATLRALHEGRHSEEIIQFIRKLDLGIDDMRLVRAEASEAPTLPGVAPEPIRSALEAFSKAIGSSPGVQQIAVQTVHERYDPTGQVVGHEIFDLNRHESEGTKKLFALAWPVLDTLRSGRVLVADEFEARLHPLLTRRLLQEFNSPESNLRHAQFVITTQDTNLLDRRMLRRDQIWFTEKNRFGATDLYSMAEFKGVRNDSSFEKDYINGRYGAIPFLGGLSTLLGESDGQAA
jgi:uncharacterized protein